MANNYFKFKKFTVFQDGCAMKVGTDGTLLGAWAEGGKHILDIGTGTGLIALMMAQRFPDANIIGVDIDESSCTQAGRNVRNSIFAERIKIVQSAIQGFLPDEKFDSVVCNPPFFVDSLNCPDEKRNIARHNSALSFRDLFVAVDRLLDDSGCFSVVLPTESFSLFDETAIEHGFRRVKYVAVKTVPRKPARRCLVAYSKNFSIDLQNCEESIEDGSHNRSQWYSELTKDFYL